MSLKKEFKSGILFSIVGRYSNVIIQLSVVAILARILNPRDFGVLGMVMVFSAFFNLLGNIGVGPAIINNKELTKEDIGVINNYIFLQGIALTVIFYFASNLIGNFYKMPELIDAAKLMSISILFNSLLTIGTSLLYRNKDFKLIAIIQIISGVMSAFVAILLAVNGFSFYAIVWQTIINSFVVFLLGCIFTRKFIKYSLKFSLSSIKKIFNYSLFQFLFNVINYFARNADNLLIGKFMGPVFLGVYDISYRLMLFPVQNLTGVFSSVLQPILSSRQHDLDMLYDNYVEFIKILFTISIPITVFIYYSASSIIYILYGHKWDSAIPILTILSLSLFVQIILSSSGAIFQVVNKTKWLFISGLLSSVIMVGSIVIGVYFHSLLLISKLLVISFYINFIQAYYILIHICFKRSFIKFMVEFWKFILVFMVLMWVLSLLNQFNYLDIMKLVFNFIVAFGLCFALLFIFNERSFMKLIRK